MTFLSRNVPECITNEPTDQKQSSIQVKSELTDEHAYYGYPTVTKGPIDVSKVKVII